MSAFDRLGREIAAALPSEPTPVEEARQLDGLADRVASRTTGRRIAVYGSLATLAAAAAMLVWVSRATVVLERAEPALVAPTDGVYEGMWLRADDNQPLDIQFPGGASVRLDPGARARVAGLSKQSVEVELETGRMRIDCTHDDGRAWTIAAGDDTVEILEGIVAVSFEAGPDPAAVEVEAGSVRVFGPDSADGRVVLGSAGTPSPVEHDEPPPAPELGAPLTPNEQGHAPQGRAKPKRRAPPMAHETVPMWKDRARAGEHAAALAAARESGWSDLLESLSANDLKLLADAARLSRHGKAAQEALVTLRRRFPEHSKGRLAAFLLGRVEIELRGNPRAAAKWFETFARENPGHTLAAKALGRAIEAHRQAKDPAGAARAARAYLAKAPDGGYAELARSALEGI